MANICVTGIWHQGAVVSACLADLGNNVRGVCDQSTAAALNAGKPPVHEPLLPEIIQQNVRAARLGYSADYRAGLQGADFVFICTDTPVNMADESDLSSICQIAENIGRNLSNDIILCITAQVPCGTSEELAKMVRSLSTHKVSVAYIPEFLRLGTAVQTFREADRVVIGCNDQSISSRIASLYEPLGRPIVHTDIRSAEMAKHASNAFLATSISFINEIAELCEPMHADALEVARILKLDKRIGKYAFLSPGLGFAGGTLGREIRTLQKFGSSHGLSTHLMDAVWEINAQRALLVGRRLTTVLGSLAGLRIGILGLTYKAGTSTMRRAISLDIIRDLVQKGAAIVAFDPLANLGEVPDLPPMQMLPDPYQVAQECDALVLVTEWAEIDSLDFVRLKSGMRGDVFLDTRNLLDPVRMVQVGFRYLGIGRSLGNKD